MKQNEKIFFHDIKNILSDKKTLVLIFFLTLITIVMGVSCCLLLQQDNEALINQLQIISKISNKNIFVSFFIQIFSFIIFTTYPFILGIVAISYLKEFGELELMMLFPINRKRFFLIKIFCIFILSILFSWISILINLGIQTVFLDMKLFFNIQNVFYFLLGLPAWLFFMSILAIKISAYSKDTKEANQKSLIFPFFLYVLIQILFIFKINIFSYKFFMVPLLVGIFGSVILLYFSNKKFNIEKIIYN